MSVSSEKYKSEAEMIVHEQMETEVERVQEYGSVGKFKNYSDLQTGAPGKAPYRG